MHNIIIIVITMIINIMIMPKVLSYMEDHLKNKQRLEQEWVGLCAYEAEPNSTAIAFKVVSFKDNIDVDVDVDTVGFCAYEAKQLLRSR